MGANDASGEGLQYALKNMHQNKFSRKLWRINNGASGHQELQICTQKIGSILIFLGGACIISYWYYSQRVLSQSKLTSEYSHR
jgi:hypothetical protein